jgi:hypothetical protein
MLTFVPIKQSSAYFDAGPNAVLYFGEKRQRFDQCSCHFAWYIEGLRCSGRADMSSVRLKSRVTPGTALYISTRVGGGPRVLPDDASLIQPSL